MASNRKQRRAQERRERKRKGHATTATFSVGEASPHATMMAIDDPPWTEFRRTAERERDGAELWENSRYIVALYGAHTNETAEGWPGVVHLSFKHRLNIAITDFRDMQRIKSELVHPEAMTLQIMPAESQLVDMANQFHLWCLVPPSWPEVPDGFDWSSSWLPIGFRGGRAVSERPPPGGRQRTFEEGQAPSPEEEAALDVLRSEHNARRTDGLKT